MQTQLFKQHSVTLITAAMERSELFWDINKNKMDSNKCIVCARLLQLCSREWQWWLQRCARCLLLLLMELLETFNGRHTSIIKISSGGLKGQSRRSRFGIKCLPWLWPRWPRWTEQFRCLCSQQGLALSRSNSTSKEQVACRGRRSSWLATLATSLMLI